MSQKRLMVQISPTADYGGMRQYGENSGLRILPEPKIFPPILHFQGPEETIDEFKQKYSGDILKVMIEEPVDD